MKIRRLGLATTPARAAACALLLFAPAFWPSGTGPLAQGGGKNTRIYDANTAPLFQSMPPVLADDVTDNRNAIFARLKRISSIGGGILRLPPGKIRMYSTLEWPHEGSHTGMMGHGMGVTELICDHSGYPSLNAGIRVTGKSSNLRLTDLTLRGTADSDAGGPYDLFLLEVHTGTNVRVENVHFRYARHAGWRTKIASNTGYFVSNCLFEDIVTPNMPGVTGGGAILTKGGSAYRFDGNTFRRCGNSNLSHALYVSETDDGEITNCVFDQRENPACRLQIRGDAFRWTVSGNSFLGLNTVRDQFNYWGGYDSLYANNLLSECRVKVIASSTTFRENRFDFTGSTSVATRAFEISGGSSPTVENLYTGNVMRVSQPSPIWRFIHAAQNLSRCIIANNLVINAQLMTSASGPTIAGSDGNTVRGNRVTYVGYTSTTQGLGFSNEDPGWFTNTLVEDNFIDTGGGAGRALTDKPGHTNTFRNNKIVPPGTTSGI